MLVWRLARQVFPVLDGEGARLYGGRWNSRGRAAVYASASRALAVLERLVGTDPEEVPSNLALFDLEIPDVLEMERVSLCHLESGWRRPRSEICRRIGDERIGSLRTPVLEVPSAIEPEEHNYLINPTHPDAARVRVRGHSACEFDSRLLLRADLPHDPTPPR
jgi:RES domain-containing protein